MRLTASFLAAAAGIALASTASAQNFADNFDSYATGMALHGTNGWKGWDNTPGAGASTSATQANSAPNSVEVFGGVDLIHEHPGASFGQWQYRTLTYVPSGSTGTSFFILLNQYNDGGPYNWSLQLQFNNTTGMLKDFDSAATTAIVYDTWVELLVAIDLDNDSQSVSYNGAPLLTKGWTTGAGTPGTATIGAVDLFANGASAMYYDDLSLTLVGAERLIISEVVDGPLPGGQPKYVELTNTGSTDIADMSLFSFGNINNGGTTLGGGSSTVLNPTSLAAGASYVYAYENSTPPTPPSGCDPAGILTCYEFVYGASPDQYAGGGFVNGDDALLLFIGPATGDGSDAILNDVYGIVGCDPNASGSPCPEWEYTDSYSLRCATSANSTFTLSEWCIAGPNALETTTGDPDELTKMQLLTSGGTHAPGCAPRVFCTGKTNSCGSTPTISATGVSSAGASSGFTVSSSNAKGGKFGLVLYGGSGLLHPGMPFAFNQGGTVSGSLCIDGQVHRGVIVMAGGTPGLCDGTLSTDMNAFAAGALGGNPQAFLLAPGTLVYAQMWGRDSFMQGDYLSDTLEYCVGL